MNISGLQFWAYGISVENKPVSTNELRVFPNERFPFVDGELAEGDDTITASGVDRFGNNYSSSVEMTNAITAEWLPLNSNRITAPDIQRGEGIIILRFKDVDKYYWIADGRQKHLRRLETIKHRLSNTRDANVSEITDDNSYFLIASTHEKHITIQTSKSDGEPFAYTQQINTKDGIVTLQDDVGNVIQLNSRDTIIILQNADGSVVELNKEIINAHANKEINISTKTLNITAETINTKATDINTTATNIKTDTQTESTTAQTITIDTSSMTTNAQTYTVTSASITLAGTIGLVGGITMAPGSGGSGMSLSGDMSTTGTITNNGVNISSTHVHPKGPSSDPNTQTPQ